MSKPILVLSREMKSYLTNSKVVCSPELKVTKAGLPPASSSVLAWTWPGEFANLKEHTRHGGTEHSEEITLKTGSGEKGRPFFKMHSARRQKGRFERRSGEWHLRDTLCEVVHRGYSGTSVQTHTHTHTHRRTHTGREAALWNRCWASPAARIHNPHTALPSRVPLLFKSPFHCSSLIHL